MEPNEEIIAIRLLEHRGGIEWAWKALYDQPHRGVGSFPIHALEVGAQLTVAVTWVKASWQIARFVNVGDHEMFTSDEPEFEFGPDAQRWLEIEYAEPIARGDIITEYVRFSASDGSGEFGKVRPCLVVSVSDSEIRYRAIHSVGGALHKHGDGVKLRDWSGAGLDNPSVVSHEVRFLLVDGPLAPERRIGRLTESDLRRVLG